jgi:hypothetical protein
MNALFAALNFEAISGAHGEPKAPCLLGGRRAMVMCKSAAMTLQAPFACNWNSIPFQLVNVAAFLMRWHCSWFE